MREWRDRVGVALPIHVRAQWAIASPKDFRRPNFTMLTNQLA
jgi:hypothetical protein